VAQLLYETGTGPPADETPTTPWEAAPAEPLDRELLGLDAEQDTPRECRGCRGKMVEICQTPHPAVAELLDGAALLKRLGPLR
jgi:hypothetical protein